MRGRSTNFDYLGSEIIKTLEQSNAPISALGINFAINNKLDKIIELNMVKTHLNILLKNKKVLQKVKDKATFYKLNPENKGK